MGYNRLFRPLPHQNSISMLNPMVRQQIVLKNPDEMKTIYENEIDIFDKQFQVNEEQTRLQLEQIQKLAEESKMNNIMLRKAGVQTQVNKPRMMHRQMLYKKEIDLQMAEIDLYRNRRLALETQLQQQQEELERVQKVISYSKEQKYISQMQTQLNQLKIQLTEQETLQQQYKALTKNFYLSEEYDKFLREDREKLELLECDFQKQKIAALDINFALQRVETQFEEIYTQRTEKVQTYKKTIAQKKAQIKQINQETTQFIQQSQQNLYNLMSNQDEEGTELLPTTTETKQQQKTYHIGTIFKFYNLKPQNFFKNQQNFSQNRQRAILQQQIRELKTRIETFEAERHQLIIEIQDCQLPIYKQLEKQQIILQDMKSDREVLAYKQKQLSNEVQSIQSFLASLEQKLHIFKPYGEQFLTMNMEIYQALIKNGENALEKCLNIDRFHSIDCLVFALMSKLQGLNALDSHVERAMTTKTPAPMNDEEEIDENQLEGREITFGKDDPNVVDDLKLVKPNKLYYTGNLPNNCRIRLPDELEDEEEVRSASAGFPRSFSTGVKIGGSGGIGATFVQSRREMKRLSTAYSNRCKAQQEQENKYW